MDDKPFEDETMNSHEVNLKQKQLVSERALKKINDFCSAALQWRTTEMKKKYLLVVRWMTRCGGSTPIEW